MIEERNRKWKWRLRNKESYSIFSSKVERVKEKVLKHELLPPVKGFISNAQDHKDVSLIQVPPGPQSTGIHVARSGRLNF